MEFKGLNKESLSKLLKNCGLCSYTTLVLLPGAAHKVS